ncbi:hypothetical protein HRR83_007929 [Exophiala dermatitidis]|uniref:Uncharacterized protein n=2 Tax=Exophiala dermatitidis TaxID=5970 RepID=H6BUH0_EXODN|nr:uncharacterized protein HMPREF1120_03837 [Exophiala dermatitidis NIH/UT8656]KAJ4506558.1 hypothetical protein HRR75_006799 [Exophiala dermatitidis]EHY55712.1 hypothetical protein HMPREF1120_03837 [Exophiala dermatitidis NIH/UT8656]KAJ4508825.1 hypothetical protein HRR74_007416 [Exophiala dermatitidis]KAJ4510077.1 hypothetical protein HRR73_006874 [Exophiala dermatitidis]KAJ4539080.1 hypothetical protein HRR77_006495 [Exophiala dermatitidis]
MASTTTPAAENGHWLLRGVQSAIFYYVSCTPCLEYKYKQKRRNEAKAQQAREQELASTQPGLVRPMAFQTNPEWAEDLLLGPGPPKGWKKDTLLKRMQKKVAEGIEILNTATNLPGPTKVPDENASGNRQPDIVPPGDQSEQKGSNTIDIVKEAWRTTLHPPKWNFQRYHREDEVLWGYTRRMKQMWNRATSGSHEEAPGQQPKSGNTPTGGRQDTKGSQDYARPPRPPANDIYAPIVTGLPATRAEAAWMLLPPPSAAVMAGKKRPAAETEPRWPLAVLGGPKCQPRPAPVLVPAHSSETVVLSGSTNDNTEGGSNLSEVEPETPQQSKDNAEPTKPAPTYPRRPLRGEMFDTKSSDSWQFHYIIPST